MFIETVEGYIYSTISTDGDAVFTCNPLEQDEAYRYYKFSDNVLKIEKQNVINTYTTMEEIGFKRSKKNIFFRNDEPGCLRELQNLPNTNTESDLSYPGMDIAEKEFREWIPKSDGEKRFKRTIQQLSNKYDNH
jgi:hypothetical protein